MKRWSAIGVVMLGLCAAPATASASWYFQWLSGGYAGPFASYDDCQRRRYLDDAHLHSNLCMEYDRPPDGARPARPPLPRQRISVGLVFGPGWTVRDVETDASEGVTAGLRVGLRISGNPRFAIDLATGAQLARMVAPSLSEQAMVPVIVPLTVGLAWSPGNDRLRFDVGAAGGMHFGLTCEVPDRSCAGFYGELHAGVAMYRRARPLGFGMELALTGSKGGGLAAPPILFRFSLHHRNLALY